MVSRFEHFSFSISEIYRYWHKIAASEMEKYGLKGPYCVYLISLSRYPQGITAAQLCEICGKDKSDVSRAMSAMQSKGFIKKTGISYRALITLTDEGAKAAEQLNETASKAVELAGNGLTDEVRTAFYQALDIISSNLQALSTNGLSI